MTEFQPIIVGIHGAPRSGTSWLGQLFNSNEHVAYRYQPFFAHSFRERVNSHTDSAGLQAFFTDLLESRDEFLLQTGEKKLARSTPSFKKSNITHLVYKEVRFHHLLPHLLESMPNMKAIGIVRDPRDVLASWANAPREFDPMWSLEREWRHAERKNAGREENWYGFERWKALARSLVELEKQWPDRCLLVRYEDLVKNPRDTLGLLFDFCGLASNEQVDDFIQDSTSRTDNEPYGVFRNHGEFGSTNGLDECIADLIADELRGTCLTRFVSARPLEGMGNGDVPIL
ncbi:MAG TPA: sulfotransferase [Dokdonella sp.]|uniref:sulfotransferase family protein n=1 Tax=Dokdonella sp. TaxID=2291710 RepID=UPI002D801114|nr:sulfotransferase [Dokdonella sp.]HET9034261.1 sulfotransferase [Dokdonella sp.]